MSETPVKRLYGTRLFTKLGRYGYSGVQISSNTLHIKLGILYNVIEIHHAADWARSAATSAQRERPH